MTEQHTVEFTQYLRPDGRKRTVFAPCSANIQKKAERIQTAGNSFECEVLTTGQISLTISNGEEDIAIELSENGPEIHQALERLVLAGEQKL